MHQSSSDPGARIKQTTRPGPECYALSDHCRGYEQKQGLQDNERIEREYQHVRFNQIFDASANGEQSKHEYETEWRHLCLDGSFLLVNIQPHQRAAPPSSSCTR